MAKPFNLPKYVRVDYAFNPQTGYYTKTAVQPSLTPLQRLPYELTVVRTQAEKIKVNAEQLIVSKERSKTGTFKFFTGIQSFGFENWFVGNDYETIKGQKVTSLILFQFCHNNSQLRVYYFHRYDKPKTDARLHYAKQVVPHLINQSLIKH